MKNKGQKERGEKERGEDGITTPNIQGHTSGVLGGVSIRVSSRVEEDRSEEITEEIGNFRVKTSTGKELHIHVSSIQ